jgi:C-terminal processing protease CtpA/Prc
MQVFDAAAYRGKRVAYTAWVRVDGADRRGNSGARAQLWMRVDLAPEVAGGQPRPGFFDNMHDRPIQSDQWAEYRVVGDVAADAQAISIGLLLMGGAPRASACLDGVRLEVLAGAGEGNQGPAPLSDRGLENLVAFTRLYGFVRYFHPSDEAASSRTDWDALAIEGVKAVEGAADAEALASSLERLFKPLAPTLRVQARPIEGALDKGTLRPAEGDDPDEIIAWHHVGIANPQAKPGTSLYRGSRMRLPWRDPSTAEVIPPVGTRAPPALGGGAWCSVPVVLFTDAAGATIPKGGAAPDPTAVWAPGWQPTGDDRATRLAAVVIAWNVLRHSYPYWDVVETDWSAALTDALRAAAMDRDEMAFLVTLRRLVAGLKDGHGGVYHPRERRWHMLPLAWDWVEDSLVITAVGPQAPGLQRGDVVVSIDGMPAAAALAEAGRLVSGATPGWIRHRALDDLRRGGSAGPVVLEVRSAGGAARSVKVARVAGEPPVAETRPEKIAEVGPGVVYVDLDRIDDGDFDGAINRLKAAKGIVFDLRGYPSRLSTVVLAHLIESPITCARWNLPVITRPDLEGVRWQFSNWQVKPISPNLARTARVAFIIGPGAISYAETYLGMVEHYRLAELVGQTTAGTNGNVNTISLPGGYQVAFTGMKVLKHDGSRHHGVGIAPTVPVERTIKGVSEGRDECLERAVEVVSAGKDGGDR